MQQYLITETHVKELQYAAAVLGALLRERDRHHFLIRSDVVEVLNVIKKTIDTRLEGFELPPGSTVVDN